MKKIKKAVIPAAGFGTRFLPYTKALPKEMICVVDKPVIQLIVEEAVESGIEEILIITSRNKNAIENHFDDVPELEAHLRKYNKFNEISVINKISNMARIYYVRQQEMLGLGHAISLAKTFTKDEPFAVLLGDDIVKHEIPALKQIINVYEKYEKSVLAVQEVNKSDVSKYGIIDASLIDDKTFMVKNIVEKPTIENAPSNIAVLGKYIFTPNIYEEIMKIHSDGVNEIQLTDAIDSLIKKEAVYAYNFDGKRYDTGDKLGYLKAIVEYALVHEEVKDEFKKYLKNLEL